MIERLKYGITRLVSCKLMRMCCIAVMAIVTAAVITLLNCSIYTIKVLDGENTYTIRTLNSNVTSALKVVKLKSPFYRINNTTVKGKVTEVSIDYTYPVYITYGDKTIELSFSGGTVEQALKEAGFTPDEADFVEPSLDTEIAKTTYIDYTDISYVSGSYIESIPYATDTVYSENDGNGVVKILQNGINGSKQVSYVEKFVNGVSAERTVTGETVLKNAVNAKKSIGTKEVPDAVKTSADVNCISTLYPESAIKLDKNGNPVNYKSKMIARATAYTYSGHNCATGVAPQPGYIAVNPKVIPYGTKLYIKSADGSIVYGYAVAADTGGFAKRYPNGIDLFMASKSACFSFGVRNMEVYILE